MSLYETTYPDGRPRQSTTEKIALQIDCTKWTSTPTSPVVDEVIDESDGTDVKSTVMPSGSASVTGSNIILPLLESLTAGRSYRIEVHFTGDNNSRLETHVRVRAS